MHQRPKAVQQPSALEPYGWSEHLNGRFQSFAALGMLPGRVDDVRLHIGPGTTAALIGESGTGKSALINRLLGTENRVIGDTREGDGKGRHTIVSRELLPLPSGGVLIDTPGLRTLGLWNGEEGVTRAFSDIENLASRCSAGPAEITRPDLSVLPQSGPLVPDKVVEHAGVTSYR